MQVAKGQHRVESELFYAVPTFDGDSIFNVFSTEPYSDARSTYYYRSKETGVGGYARGWGRRYHSEDAEASMAPANRYAGGAQLGVDYRLAPERVLRLDAFHEDGYGGQRTGGYLSGLWRWSDATLFRGRVSMIRFDEDLRTDLRGYNAGAQFGTTYLFHPGLAGSLMVEQNSNRLDPFQLGIFAMFDLAFQPET